MSGVAIVRFLLKSNATLTATVPESRIVAGKVDQTKALPAIWVTTIDDGQYNTLKMAESTYVVRERVQVTIHAKTYLSAKQIKDLVLDACPVSLGTVNTFTCQGVVPDAGGPDFYDKASEVYQLSQDFIVHFVR